MEIKLTIESLKSFDKNTKRLMNNSSLRFAKAGFPGFIGSFWETLDSLIQTEIKNRRYKIAELLNKSDEIKERQRRKEKKHHDRSLRRINMTIKNFKEERKLLNTKYLEKMDEVLKDKVKFGRFKDMAIETLQDSFLETSEEATVVMEVIDIFKDTLNKVGDGRGADGLLDYIEEGLEELKRVRSEEKDRGREHRSPIAWWKAALFYAMAGIYIAIVIYCWGLYFFSKASLYYCMALTFGIPSALVNALIWALIFC